MPDGNNSPTTERTPNGRFCACNGGVVFISTTFRLGTGVGSNKS